ncbi:hypothetical protein HerbRD11066_05320 [Herbidospora sp. RD11066]
MVTDSDGKAATVKGQVDWEKMAKPCSRREPNILRISGADLRSASYLPWDPSPQAAAGGLVGFRWPDTLLRPVL